MSRLSLELSLAQGIQSDQLSLTLKVSYVRILENNDENEESISANTQVFFKLPDKIESTFIIDDYADNTEINLAICNDQGVNLLLREKVTPEKIGDTFTLKWTLADGDIKILSEPPLKPEELQKYITRKGRFVYLGNTDLNYTSFDLLAVPYIGSNEESESLKKFFKIDDIQNYTRLIKKAERDQLSGLSFFMFSDMSLKIDGEFEISLAKEKDIKGWLWVLSGEKLFSGLILDPATKIQLQPITIFLPNNEEEQTVISNNECIVEHLPLDASEDEIIRNPELFHEDPGAYCEPFNNPNRVIGERTFQTILRVTDPEINGWPSVAEPGSVSSDIPTTSLIPETYLRILEQPYRKKSENTSVFRSIINALVPSSAIESAQPTLSNLKMLRRKWVVMNSTGRTEVSAKNPIKWEGDPSIYQAATVAFGHILDFRVRWRSNGYSLGDIAQTLTLAPRQTKRITMLEWARTEEAARIEATVASDLVQNETTRERDYLNAVQSNLNEWSRGGSKASTTGAAAGIGFVVGPVVVGGGAAHGRSSSSSWQQGGRSVSAREEQSLRDAIRQYGESLRRFESTVVQEVTQTETITGISEVLRNPNYCHSLTVIYHQILRHLRIDTEAVGARECVFVPFSIKPFDLERIIRWRDSISLHLRKRQYMWVLKYLEDLRNNFQNSEIPAGSRASHPIQFIRGSIYLKLAIERPRNNEDDEFVEDNWRPLIPFLGIPALSLYHRLKNYEKHMRDSYFQRDHCPQIARDWANELIIEANGVPLTGADFTLASEYRFNGTVRVDFTYLPNEGKILTRNDLTNFTVRAGKGLPASSVANVERVTIQYSTANFDRSISTSSGSDDIINVTNGQPDSGARLYFRLSSWEMQDLRAEIREGASKLLTYLNEHLEYYHKAIWWNMDRDKIYMMLDGFEVPGGDGRSLASIVERNPIAILGNTLVFRVAAGVFLGVDTHKSPEELDSYYRTSTKSKEPLLLALPTAGLYAQALMDKCVACEEHFGSVDWVLSDKEPELTELGPEEFRSRRTEPGELKPTEFQAPIINLQNAPTAPEVSGLKEILNAVTKSDAFRDMAGLAGTQASARAAMETAASLAKEFGSKAIDLEKAKLGTAKANEKVDSIQRAKDKGLIDEEQAKDLAKKSLEEMNMDKLDQKLSTEPEIREVISKAGNNLGTPLSVGRGSEYIQVGGSASAIGGGIATPVSDVITFPGTSFKYKKCTKSLESCLETLSPNLRSDFKSNIENVIKNIHEIGFALGTLEKYDAGYRTFQEQYDIDPSKTNAGPGESFHNYGLAVDLGFLQWIDEDGEVHDEDYWLGTMDGMGEYSGFSNKLWDKRDSFKGSSLHTISGERIHMQGIKSSASGRMALVKTLNKSSVNGWKYRKNGDKEYDCNFGVDGDWKKIGTAKQMWNKEALNATDEQKQKIRDDMEAAESKALTIDISDV